VYSKKQVGKENGQEGISLYSRAPPVLAVTPKNANVAMVLLFLYKLVHVLKNYFNAVEEESIRDNFIIVYELLDEMMDFGYPQATDAKVLKEYEAFPSLLR